MYVTPNPLHPSNRAHSSTKSCLLVLDRDITAGSTLVLAPNEVGDLLVLSLLDGRLVVLSALAQELLLDEVDSLVLSIHSQSTVGV